MPLAHIRTIPAAIPLIAIPWFLVGAFFALACFEVFEDSARSAGFGIEGVPWETTVLIIFMNYIPPLVLIGLAADAFSIAGGLLLGKAGSARRARYFAFAWALAWLMPFAMIAADRDARLDLETTISLVAGATYNLWSGWYLSRAKTQEKLGQELIFLHLRN